MILKPSEKVPLTMTKVMELFKEAGLPDGVVNIVHGAVDGALPVIYLFLLSFECSWARQ